MQKEIKNKKLLIQRPIEPRDISERKIFKKYPKIFRQKDLSPRETCMCWGLEIGLGWYWLVDKLCEFLQFNIDKNNQPQLEAVQVKEKFGGLRFYVTGANSEQQKVIDFVEFLSHFICERCGTTKNVSQTKGWIKTLCKTCRKKEGG